MPLNILCKTSSSKASQNSRIIKKRAAVYMMLRGYEMIKSNQNYPRATRW
eukprot:CAMPEP_0179005104 /NCGR_PEP_ID=MMETSP0795-20121207/13711_1 /TAXON_ID=88552 /ORGANISM="Amoebophrya sp., Strain Ameob2" /LENGTH=49 /DNA_ID= /DNA_START= /DNA_END= /DNA_ORIENTATION=